MRVLLLALGALVLVGCSHSSGVGAAPAYDENPQPRAITNNPGALPLTQITLICQPGPEDGGYALILDYGGTAFYMGGANSPLRRGKYTSRFDRAGFDSLRKLIETSHFSAFDSYYGSSDSKLPVTTVSMLWNGLRKSVIDRGGSEHPAPKTFKKIKDSMEALVSGAHWTLCKPVAQVPEFSPQYDTLQPGSAK